ncbi:4-hydroxyproline epimerase [Flavobacteriaceae bacterium]|jgi:4-hydroxyproline epimerase|nr:4-hydroxyproline epimerase [Flavobacteriaceae bacterium]MDA9852059.1 4-hydroxyproline epimerase [Flavobacteriaceae bacterium]MDC0386014.1 4-hydroxyproline epimerase [Flavobacteriaceae bacterium]
MNADERIVFDCVDAYTAGNPVRLVKGPAPVLKGENMGEKRLHFIKEYDWIRTGLMFEPHGHDMMSGSFFYTPQNQENDVAILFIETSGCLPMCGHGLIGALTVLLEEKLITPKKEGKLNVETPAGLVVASYEKKGSKVTGVKFTNVPAFLAASDLEIECPELGRLKIDVSYGGNFYAIIDLQENFEGIAAYTAGKLVGWSREIRQQINTRYNFEHPLDEKIRGCSHVLWAGKPTQQGATASNAVFYGDKAIDRSPCGTGTSARMAQWYAKGKLKVGDSFVHESIIGSIFTGCVEAELRVGNLKGIVPSIEGNARVIGYNQLILDPEDPYVKGFQVI